MQCCIVVPVLNSDQHKDVRLYLLQEYNSSELAIAYYSKTAQTIAAAQQELQLAETYSELHHARDVIDDLNAQLNTVLLEYCSTAERSVVFSCAFRSSITSLACCSSEYVSASCSSCCVAAMVCAVLG